MTRRKIEVTLTLKEVDLNRMLAACYFGNKKSPKVKDLSEEQFAKLTCELQDTASAFVDEIVDSSGDCSDWLFDFMEQFE